MVVEICDDDVSFAIHGAEMRTREIVAFDDSISEFGQKFSIQSKDANARSLIVHHNQFALVIHAKSFRA